MNNILLFNTMLEDEKEFNMTLLESNIEIEKIYNECKLALGLESVDSVFTEAEKEESNSVFMKAVSAIIAKVVQVFESFCNLLRNIFGKSDEEAAMKAYFDAPSTSIKMVADIVKIRKQAEEDAANGNKLVRKISSATGAKPTEVKSFCDKAGKFARFAVPITLTAGSIWAAKKLVDYRSGSDSALEKIKDAEAYCKKINDPVKKEEALQVIRGMKDAYTEDMKYQTKFLTKLKREYEANKDIKKINEVIGNNTDYFLSNRAKKKIAKEDKRRADEIEAKRVSAEKKEKAATASKEHLATGADKLDKIFNP